jgi:ribosomal protein L44E
VNRKQRREMEKVAGKDSTQKLAEKISQFDQLPEACSACTKPYDKKDKKMASIWNVVAAPDAVRLYCPECWDTARTIAEEYKSRQNVEG